jgi:hypothetical protein
MTRFPALLALTILTSATAAAAQAPAPPQAPAPQPSVTLPPELDRVLRDYERFWRAGDTLGLSAIFTDDGFVPTRGGWVRGTAAIRNTYRIASGNLNLRAHAYAVSDTVGYIIGAFGYQAGTDNGKFVLALRRRPGGQWLIAADLDQGNR